MAPWWLRRPRQLESWPGRPLARPAARRLCTLPGPRCLGCGAGCERSVDAFGGARCFWWRFGWFVVAVVVVPPLLLPVLVGRCCRACAACWAGRSCALCSLRCSFPLVAPALSARSAPLLLLPAPRARSFSRSLHRDCSSLHPFHQLLLVVSAQNPSLFLHEILQPRTGLQLVVSAVPCAVLIPLFLDFHVAPDRERWPLGRAQDANLVSTPQRIAI